MVYLAGHLPIPPASDGRPMLVGRLGENFTIEQGQEAGYNTMSFCYLYCFICLLLRTILCSLL